MEWENVVAGQRADPEQINKIGNQVSAYKGLRLARRIVLTEVVSSITFDTDDDGNPLDSRLGGELLLSSGSNDSIGNGTQVNMQLNDIKSNSYWYNVASAGSSMYIGYMGNLFSLNAISIFILNGVAVARSTITYRYAGGGGDAVRGGGMTMPQTSINSIRFFVAVGTFPIGTVLEWWERG